VSANRLVRTYAGQHRGALAGAAATSIVTVAADLARPWPLKIIVDDVLADYDGAFALTSRTAWLVVAVAALVLVIALADALASYFNDLLLGRAGERITHDLRVAVYSHLQRLSLRFHDSRRKGDLVTRVTGDVNAVGSLFTDTLGTIAQSVLLLVGMVAVSFYLDPVVALGLLLALPPLAFTTFRYRRELKATSRQQRAQEGDIASFASEALGAMPMIKAAGAEAFEERRLRDGSERRWRTGVHLTRIEARFSGFIDALGALATAAVIVLGVLRASVGAVSPGDIIVFGSYTRRAYRPLRDMARQAGRASQSMARAERIAEILDQEDTLAERAGAYRGDRAVGALDFEDVAFAYGPERETLRGVSLSVAPGARTALVGASGAGKSTMGALAARFYDPDGGRVLLDGRDLRDCSLPWLREQVGFLLQDTVLFRGTVAENIAYGVEASHDAVVAAATAAAAHDFVMSLPEGYETILGPDGRGLSGGQRQRIGIARVLLRDPPVLILDEPTTGLDIATEQELLLGLDLLMRGRTTIVITHSMPLAATADRVVVMGDGRLLREGPPRTLLPQAAFSEEHRSHRRPPAPPRPVAPNPAHAPRDPALPWLATLLDPQAMTSVLERSLGWDAALGAVDVRYLRYKPGTSLVVHYGVELSGAQHDAVVRIAADRRMSEIARRPRALALSQAVEGRSPATSALVYDDELDALIQWLPLDLDLPALAEAPARLARRLSEAGFAAGPTTTPRLLGYNPRRRAVLRTGELLLKVYADDERFTSAMRANAAASDAPAATSTFVAELTESRIGVQRWVENTHPGGSATEPALAGAALRELHRAPARGVPVVSASDHLRAGGESARQAVIVAPALEARLERLLGRLEARLPAREAPVLAHGDYHAGQVLSATGGPVIVDLDRACLASASLDLATYTAHLHAGDERSRDEAASALDALTNAYGERPEALDWYTSLAILRRLPHPFRVQADAWPERMEALLSDAEEAAR